MCAWHKDMVRKNEIWQSLIVPKSLGVLLFSWHWALLKRVYACDSHLKPWPRAGNVNKLPHNHLTITITASPATLYVTSGAFLKETEKKKNARERRRHRQTDKETQREKKSRTSTMKGEKTFSISDLVCYSVILSYILLSLSLSFLHSPFFIFTFDFSFVLSLLLW